MKDLLPASAYDGRLSPSVVRLVDEYHTRWNRFAYEDLAPRAECLDSIARLAASGEAASESAAAAEAVASLARRRAAYLRSLVLVARRRPLSTWVLTIWQRWRPPGALSVVADSILSEAVYYWDPALRSLAFHRSAKSEWLRIVETSRSSVPDYFLWLEGHTEPEPTMSPTMSPTVSVTLVQDYLYVVLPGSSPRLVVAPADRGVYHTQLSRGARVQCAGHMRFDPSDGRMIYVDNRSGHYRPSPSHLKRFLENLPPDSVANLSHICVVRPGETYDQRRVVSRISEIPV